METKDLVQQAQEREYTNFDQTAKDILSQKIATALQDKGYFKRLEQAQGKSMNEDKAEYKKVYDTELAKFDAKSPADLSDADKKKFFNAVDAAYEADGEKPEPGDK